MRTRLITSNLAVGFDFEEDLDGFQILVRYNVRAHSGSCSIRNFRSVPFSGHCGECRRPLRHTEARPNDHLFLEIIFQKNYIYSTTQTQTSWSFYKKSSHSTKESLSCALTYLLLLVPFKIIFISGTSWEKFKYLAEHKYRIKCMYTLKISKVPNSKYLANIVLTLHSVLSFPVTPIFSFLRNVWYLFATWPMLWSEIFHIKTFSFQIMCPDANIFLKVSLTKWLSIAIWALIIPGKKYLRNTSSIVCSWLCYGSSIGFVHVNCFLQFAGCACMSIYLYISKDWSSQLVVLIATQCFMRPKLKSSGR